jgi:LuxR family maltose regulon positive regulatory protein
VEELSPREFEVLRLLALGDSNADIARKLVITLNTTKKHITHIFGKLGVANRAEAIARAKELGWIR